MSSERPYPESVILLPVHRPSVHLDELITGLLTDGADAGRIVVVDDGSGPQARPILSAARSRGCAVLHHPANRGKGIALKTGFRYAQQHHPGLNVISADADGQHSPADIRRVASRAAPGRIVLGVRRFELMPPRSRFGNTVTRSLFRAATGRSVSDTQTGLRGYPAESLDHLCGIEGERFEYEMNVLLDAAACGRPIEEVAIETTYLNGNAASNFSSVTDSWQVYGPLLRFTLASLPARA